MLTSVGVVVRNHPVGNRAAGPALLPRSPAEGPAGSPVVEVSGNSVWRQEAELFQIVYVR